MNINELKKLLLHEVFKAIGLESFQSLRYLLGPLLSPAAGRFAELAAHFDDEVGTYGFHEASHRLLPLFTRDICAHGTEGIPADGPLLILSNHPGTYDGLVIASSLSRPDLKIIATGGPFIRGLPATANHLIYSSHDTFERMNVVRSAIRHLQRGGAVLIFPSGGIDPDPAVMPGALEGLETWSPSLEVILRHAPSTRILIAFVSGVLHAGWIRSPIIRVRRGRRNQQRVAEFLQVIQQTLFPNSLSVRPLVSFAEPLPVALDGKLPSLSSIIERAKEHFMQVAGKPGFGNQVFTNT